MSLKHKSRNLKSEKKKKPVQIVSYQNQSRSLNWRSLGLRVGGGVSSLVIYGAVCLGQCVYLRYPSVKRTPWHSKLKTGTCITKKKNRLSGLTLKHCTQREQQAIHCWARAQLLSCLWLCDPVDYSPQGSSVHGIFQVRILEQVAISFSRDSSLPRDWTQVSCFSCIGRWILYHCITWELLLLLLLLSCISHVRLCDPIDGSPQGFPVPGILLARTLEWVAISFSNAWKWKVKVKSLSRVWPSATPWTAAFQASPSMGFSRQEYWSRVRLPSPKVAWWGWKPSGQSCLPSASCCISLSSQWPFLRTSSPPGTHRVPVLIPPPSKNQNFPVAARRAAHAMWWQENLRVFQMFHVIVKSQHLQFGWNPIMSIHIRTCWLRAFWGQFSSAAQSCPTLCDPMDHSTPGFPVHHKLLDLAQTHVHLRSDVRICIAGEVEKGGCCPGVCLDFHICHTLVVSLLQLGHQPNAFLCMWRTRTFQVLPKD